MKTLSKIAAMLVLGSALFMACQKEVSFEQGTTVLSVGSLATDASGNCLGASISGTYYKDTTIKASNYVDVSVKVDSVGLYTVATDTVNGYYFKATGTFSATGTQTVRLMGGGKPLGTGTNIFTVRYNGTVCEFTITVTGPSAGGGAAAFTINCTGAAPAGSYAVGTALTTSNTVVLNVNVTTAGSWSVTTAPAVNGMTFSGTGTFSATGAQTITLNGSGTPAAASTSTFTVTGGTGTCTFPVTVTATPTTGDYFPRTTYSNWSYNVSDGINSDTLLYKVIPETKSIGSTVYNIFMLTTDATQGFDTSGYYRKAGSDYFEWNDMSYYTPIESSYWMEINFLKDNQAVGFKWTSSQFTGPITVSGTTTNYTLRWEFTILQQNASVTVGSTTYANTIKVKQELQVQQGTPWSAIYYAENYFAKDKGLIKQYWFDSGTGTTFFTQDVKRIAVY